MRSINQVLTVIMLIMGVYMFSLQPGGLDIVDEYIVFLPVTILSTFSIYAVIHTRGISRTMAYIILGIALAIFAGQLNTLNILVPEIITATFTLQYLQALLIMFSAIIGIISQD